MQKEMFPLASGGSGGPLTATLQSRTRYRCDRRPGITASQDAGRTAILIITGCQCVASLTVESVPVELEG